MRLSASAVVAVVALSSATRTLAFSVGPHPSAFVTSATAVPRKHMALSMAKSDENWMESAQQGFLSVVTAGVLLFGSSMAVLPVEPAFAASNKATKEQVVTSKTAAAAPSMGVPAQELALLRSDIVDAKTKLTAASSVASADKATFTTAQQANNEAKRTVDTAQKKYKATKANLIAQNDKLSELKKKGSKNTDSLTQKVAQEKVGLAAADKELTGFKAIQATKGKTMAMADTSYQAALKSEDAAKKTFGEAESKLKSVISKAEAQAKQAAEQKAKDAQ
eukprot:scaffold52077_cov52-Attheya_sp.AAC.6